MRGRSGNRRSFRSFRSFSWERFLAAGGEVSCEQKNICGKRYEPGVYGTLYPVSGGMGRKPVRDPRIYGKRMSVRAACGETGGYPADQRGDAGDGSGISRAAGSIQPPDAGAVRAEWRRGRGTFCVPLSAAGPDSEADCGVLRGAGALGGGCGASCRNLPGCTRR